METNNSTPLLELINIDKSFPGVRALDKARLKLEAGSVHALMGENGAGKSTLMKCLFGVYKYDGGEIHLNGKAVEFKSARDALDHGVAMVHQELNQALKLTAAENMWLGRYPKISKYFPFVDTKAMNKKTKEIYDNLGLNISPTANMDTLSVSERQMAEIAKAVSYNASVIVFDEPTSSLSEKEADKLFNIIEKLKKKGCGIIYISHKMSEILRICDTVTVMRDGKHIITERADSLTTDKIISLMVGRELKERYPKREMQIGEPMLELNGISAKGGLPTDASLTLREGEILGIAGLDGAGKTELVETVFGLREMSSGEIILDGKTIKNKNPQAALKNGFALLTEERHKSGIFGILDIRENTTLSSLWRFLSFGLINDSKRSEATRESIHSLRIKCPSEHTKISTLSGGNQQKVILSRWLLTNPRVLLLDEPTRGVDVGAKYEIYTLINKLALDGRGVIIVSSEMAELLGICDRIAVMSGGKIAGLLDKAEATQESIMALAGKYI